MKDFRTGIDTVKDASVVDLLTLSLFLLPVLLGAWSYFLNTNAFLDGRADIKFLVNCAVGLLFVVALVWTHNSEKARLERAARRLQSYLQHRNGHRMSFIAAREEVSKKYSDDFLRKLISENPGTFRPIRVKERGPGIALVAEDETAVEGPAA